MMKIYNIKYLMIIFLAILTTSCFFSEANMTGRYVIKNHKETIDTLELFKGNKYKRKLYRKNKKKIYENTGIWKLESNSRINFSQFLVDRDIVYSNNHKVNEEGLMFASFPIEGWFSKTKIIVEDHKNFFYEKID